VGRPPESPDPRRPAPITLRTDLADITDAIEVNERSEHTLRKLPTEPNDRADPIDPADKIDPTDPIDRIEPFELIDRMEAVELIDHREARFEFIIPSLCPHNFRHALRGVFTAAPDGPTTNHSPPALVRAWPVALPGEWSGGHR